MVRGFLSDRCDVKITEHALSIIVFVYDLVQNLDSIRIIGIVTGLVGSAELLNFTSNVDQRD